MTSKRLIQPLVGGVATLAVAGALIVAGAGPATGSTTGDHTTPTSAERSSTTRFIVRDMPSEKIAPSDRAQVEKGVVIRGSAAPPASGDRTVIVRTRTPQTSLSIRGGRDAEGKPVDLDLRAEKSADGSEKVSLTINGEPIDVSSYEEALEEMKRRGIDPPNLSFDFDTDLFNGNGIVTMPAPPAHPAAPAPPGGLFERRKPHSGGWVFRAQPNEDAPTRELPRMEVPQPQAMIGVVLAAPGDDLRLYLGLDENVGALVSKVLPDSPAAKAGLRSRDLITAVTSPVEGQSERRTVSPNELRSIIAASGPGSKLELHVLRAGQPVDVSVELKAFEPDAFGTVAPMPPAGPPAPRARGFMLDEDTLRQWVPRIDEDAMRLGIEELLELEGLEDHKQFFGDDAEELFEKIFGEDFEIENLLPDGFMFRFGPQADDPNQPQFFFFNEGGDDQGMTLEVLPDSDSAPPAPPAPPSPPAALGDEMQRQMESMRARMEAQMREMERMIRELEELRRQQEPPGTRHDDGVKQNPANTRPDA